MLASALILKNKEGNGPMTELFSKILSHVSEALKQNPKGNIIDPQYTVSRGRVPLTILSNLPDIIRHYCQLILTARKEVLLATNAWKNSESVKAIGHALRELSRRQMENKSQKIVVVKIMFMMISPKLLIHKHVHILEPELSSNKVGLPEQSEIPGIKLEVVNYHNVPLGTLHSKFMVIDSNIAVVGSNNIQDNANLEMSCDFQGPVVANIRKVFLQSWNPLETENLSNVSSGEATKEQEQTVDWDGLIAEISTRWRQRESETRLDCITRCLNSTYSPDVVGDLQETVTEHTMFLPCVKTLTEDIPIALVNRNPSAAPVEVVFGHPKHKNPVPQNEAWLAAVNYAQQTVFIQTPDFNAEPIIDAVLNAARRRVQVTLFVTCGYNDAGEMVPSQGGHNDAIVAKMYASLEAEYQQYLKIYWYVGRDMSRPHHASARCRNSHVKLMIVDSQIGIMGSGNQDAQSWYHSQEINLMIDSALICQKWMEMLQRNQNTKQYGFIDPDTGVWRDPSTGSDIPGAYGPNAGIKDFTKAAYLSIAGLAK